MPWSKVNDLLMTFDPTSIEVACVTLPKDRIQVPWKYIKVCGYSDYFQNLNHLGFNQANADYIQSDRWTTSRMSDHSLFLN